MPRFEQNIAPVPERTAQNPFTRQPIVIPGRPGKNRFWEIERHGTTLLVASGVPSGKVKQSKQEFGDEDEAHFALGGLIAKKRRAGFVEVGPSRELAAPTPARPPGSALLVDEFFAAGDPRFLDELLHFEGVPKLAALAEHWHRDARPFARKMLLDYIDDGCDRRHHKALVKRLFKLAEAAADDEAMAHFMVAFDRLSRRTLTHVGARWNPTLRRADPVMGLRGDPTLPDHLEKDAKGKHALHPRFSKRTRTYLTRRVFRYFRRLGHKDAARYGRAMRAALPLYRDENLSTPARLLDAWGLMHALYGWCKVLEKAPRGLRLREGSALSELEPAPYFAPVWEHVFDELVVMLLAAKSRTVRAWTTTLLRRSYPNELRGLGFAHVRLFLKSPHEELQRLGGELLGSLAGLETMKVSDWLDLLTIDTLDVLAIVCDLVRKYVAPARLTLEQCVDLASSKAAPVATLGLGWAKEKPIRDKTDLRLALRLDKAGVPAVRKEGSQWCAHLLTTLAFAEAVDLRDLCDAPFDDARAEGLACLAATPRFKGDLPLWFALTESPYDDVRAFILLHAEAWKKQAEPSTLAHVWASALLAVHRGGLAKRRVPREISERIIAYPGEAETFLPILGVALRSVRPTERAQALASLTRAVTKNAALRELARKHLPEVVFTEQVAT
jgi:predicted DNA-binding WGR domain protein